MELNKSDLDKVKKLHTEFSEEAEVIKASLPYLYEEKAFDDLKKIASFLH